MINKSYPILVIIFIISFLFAKKQIEGFVFDNITKEPLGGVNVISQVTKVGSSTNNLGEFNLELNDNDSILIFDHIGYESIIININNYKESIRVGLNQRVIPLKNLNVLGQTIMGEFSRLETKNMVSDINLDDISIRSYSDIGDVLLNEESVAMSENSRGIKTLSVRGARQEEVVYMYDGVRMYNGGRKSLDLSMLDIGGLQSIEILRGNHESSNGSSAVINFVPKIAYKNNLRFYQRFGTYNTGSYHTGFSLGNSSLSLDYNMGEGMSRQFYETIDNIDIATTVNNSSISTGYRLLPNTELKYYQFNSSRGYSNYYTGDSITSILTVNTIKFDHGGGHYGEFEVYLSDQVSAGEDRISQLKTDREDTHFITGLTYTLPIDNALIELALNRSKITAEWATSMGDILIERDNILLSSTFGLMQNKKRNGFEIKDINLSVNSNIIEETLNNETNLLSPIHSWRGTGVSASASAWDDLEFGNIFIYTNIGNNFRVPSISERYAHALRPDNFQGDSLLAEYKIMKEVGVKFTPHDNGSESDLSGSVSFFHYNYSNKIKTIQYGGTPLQFPLNFGSAHISGVELNMLLFILNDRIGFRSIYSSYNFSDQLTFQMQPRSISRQSIILKLGSLRCRIGIKNEGNRIMTTVDESGSLENNYLNEYTSLDINISYRLSLKGFEISMGIFGQNLNDDRQVLEGISIFDRRVYLTMGLEWH